MSGKAERRFFLFLCWILFAAVTVQAQQGDEPSAPPKNAVVEQLQVTYRYRNNGTGEIVHTARLRILTETGLKLYGAVYTAYSSRLESLRIDYLRTIKADGTVIAADPSKAMDITPPVTRTAPLFSDVKIKALVAPQLQVGDEIEYQYTRKIRTPYMRRNFWAMYSLNRANPIKAATIVLDIPAARKVTFESDPCFHYTVEKKDGRKVYKWHIENIKPPLDTEAHRPPLFAVSTLSNWKQVADWYAALQAKGLKVTPAIQAEANKLAAGKTTPEQKLDAIYTYVTENTRYVALEFGIGGYRAHAASVVLANGYGDCKDMSNLLEALLAAVGIKAYPVLVNAVSNEIEPTVPMPSQFDHVMIVVPMDGTNIWLDSTLQTAPPGILSPSVMGKRALLIERGSSRLITVPDSPPSPQQDIATATGSVDAAGKLTLHFAEETAGFVGVYMRQVFRLQDKSLLAKIVKRMAGYQLAGATGSHSSSSNPDDLTQAFKYQYTIARVSYLDILEKDQEVPLPILAITPDQWQTEIAKADKEDKEAAKSSSSGCATNPQTKIRLYGPFEQQETLNLTIPGNYKVVLPEPIHVVRPFGSYTSSYSFDHGHFQLHRDLKLNAAKIPHAELEMLRNFQGLINDDLKQELTLRRTGSPAVFSEASSMTARELNAAGLVALLKHHKPILARTLLLKAAAKDPKTKDVWNNLARAYATVGNYYQAERADRKQLTINPYDQYAYGDLGLYEADQQHYGRAITYYKQQLSVNPLDGFAQANLAAAYVANRDWADAAATYASAVRVHPSNPLLYAEWGSALLRSGKTGEGRQALEQALQISKRPVVLNNVAYAMAQSGVELGKAEGYARSAVDQTIPENVASLEGPKDYDSTLTSLASFLDTLGWTLYKEGKLAEAGSCLRAAFGIQRIPVVARHLAMLAMRQNQPSEARRYYSYAAAKFGGVPLYIPKELQDYMRNHHDQPRITATWVAAAQKKMQELDRLTLPQGHSFSWPRGAGAKPAWVILNVLVDAQGHGTAAKFFKGSEPYSSAALRDVRQLQFPRVAWTHHSLATVRTATFLYDPESHNPAEKVMVFGSLGNYSKPTDQSRESDFELGITNGVVEQFVVAGHARAGLELLRQEVKSSKNVPQVYRFMVLLARDLKQEGELKAATAVLQEAVPLQPKDDFAVRQLVKTLKASGDRAGTIKAYQQLLKMDPEDAASHYSLATEYEAAATAKGGPQESLPTAKAEHNAGSKSQNKQTRQSDSQLALTQYSLAATFSPKDAKYRHAYQTLYERINHAPPPAAAHNPKHRASRRLPVSHRGNRALMNASLLSPDYVVVTVRNDPHGFLRDVPCLEDLLPKRWRDRVLVAGEMKENSPVEGLGTGHLPLDNFSRCMTCG